MNQQGQQGVIPPLRMLHTYIRVAGLARPLRIVQVTDSHLSEADERASVQVQELAKHRTAAFGGEASTMTTTGRLAAQIAEINACGADAAVFTGDIIDFPSAANLERMSALYEALEVPYLYTLGNHDWNYPFLGEDDEHRQQAYPAFGAWASDVPGCEILQLDGVALIALDNSTYQISAEQAAKVAQAAAAGPCLLFMHIPLAVESLLPDVERVWQAPIVTGVPMERLVDYPQHPLLPPDAHTAAFSAWAQHTTDLIGIGCGHVHFDHEDRMASGRSQYVTPPGYDGYCRMYHLLPE